ncbi:hypothetical protein [Arabidopsis thaliana]|uniref:B3 domain-containing protein At4g02870 n=2 Tax=Arabidopsis TaxID=3701 RepID=Y4287_ARATH|nr:B3 domain protein [Arabidopsis thaliana]Q9SY12.1 RecName: Full=B3 domain-containing protein At4g02870; AltName: Full=Protein AUXIN RESPONSE FACTOR 42 [Arabidopsis thaliana]KAG7619435.1 DNA-binding pseudobarrel domain superfamily [Arabidopsis suecica]AAD15342.1 hypothetical protein [Arabidopsis thaliana]AEE82240.1 B3 domain protein [Arabidopsis thaliana]CAB77772.1 hypothetical protein [Arabidopsis thaliana]CAD59228.1 putative auxin response factor 42 [Arabidopsis thaliana]|eukprot:NP_192196.1 B3 domain protein [Arabidopsis thaliana]
MTLSDDPISPSTQESSNSSYVRSKEAEKNSPSQETDEEVLKGYESYRENPSNYDNDNILIYTDTFNLYDDMFEGSLDSTRNFGAQKDPNVLVMQRLLHNSGSLIGVDMEQDGIDLATLFADSTEDSKLPYVIYEGLEMQGEGYGTNTRGPFENKIDIGSFGKSGSVMNVEREKEKIVMIPTPRFGNATPQWTIKKKLSSYDIRPRCGRLILQSSSFNEHIGRHLPKDQMIKINVGVNVNVYDYDTGTLHELRLEYQRQYGLAHGWQEDFVRRRHLKQKDEIGLLWDFSSSRLQFGVISRNTGPGLWETKD